MPIEVKPSSSIPQPIINEIEQSTKQQSRSIPPPLRKTSSSISTNLYVFFYSLRILIHRFFLLLVLLIFNYPMKCHH